MKYIILIITFSLVIASCFQCKESGCPDELVYELPTQMLTKGDTIEIGDTIFISCSFSEKLLDTFGRIENIFEDFDFKLQSTIIRMDTSPNLFDCTPFFDLYSTIGDITPNVISNPSEGFYYIEPSTLDNKYSFRYFLVAKVSGTYFFSQGSASGSGQQPEGVDPPQNCKNSKLRIFQRVNKGMENGHYMIADNHLSNFNKTSNMNRGYFDSQGGFCFVVK